MGTIQATLDVVGTVDVLDQSTEMGIFLRLCRARLQPADVGLMPYGSRRRVPGLRREELAQLAGVSVAYYTRLEQGQSRNASDGVLDAIARALRLDHDETTHLRNLARPAPPGRARPRPERLRPGLAAMVTSLDMPAYVVGRYGDILAWNRIAHTLLAGHIDYQAPARPADRPNLSRMLFLDPHTRELDADWNQRARRSVACLRVTAGRHPGDHRLISLIGELTMQSPAFASLWSTHQVRRCAYNTERYRHPLVGLLTLNEEVFDLPDDNGQQLVMLVADQDSPSQAALDLLAAVTHSSSSGRRGT